jgi:HB1, ASXL, restriction endonuclease HTH domain
MTYFEAAVAILRRAGRPLTAREIAAAAIKQGLIVPKGRTPEQTMSATLYTRAAKSDPLLVKLETRGHSRAQRGSVRWSVHKTRGASR